MIGLLFDDDHFEFSIQIFNTIMSPKIFRVMGGLRSEASEAGPE